MLVLLLDDVEDEYILFLKTLNLYDPSIKSLYTSSGQKALKYLSSTPVLPDFIFLDISMPLMDGKECLKSFKSNPALKDIRVVIYSTNTNKKEIDELLSLGAFDVIRKPMRLDDFSRVFRKK
jgi:CheY-like chemotaxis protein